MGGWVDIAVVVAGAAQLVAAVPAVREAQVPGADVPLAALVDLGGLPAPLAARIGALPVARFRPGETMMTLDDDRLAQRIAALAPGLAARLDWPAGGRIIVRRKRPQAERPMRPCARLTAAVPAGAILVISDIKPATCPAAPGPAAIRYERRLSAFRALRNLHPGELIAAPAASAMAEVRPGEPLYIAARFGPVLVQRRVVALQPGRAGRGLFVRAADGEVFPAPAIAAAP